MSTLSARMGPRAEAAAAADRVGDGSLQTGSRRIGGGGRQGISAVDAGAVGEWGCRAAGFQGAFSEDSFLPIPFLYSLALRGLSDRMPAMASRQTDRQIVVGPDTQRCRFSAAAAATIAGGVGGAARRLQGTIAGGGARAHVPGLRARLPGAAGGALGEYARERGLEAVTAPRSAFRAGSCLGPAERINSEERSGN
jgi:hypothetical protein